MRTGNKLLLAFVAFIILLMLLSDIVLWADFKNGKTGDEKLSEDETHATEFETHSIPLQPVKVLQVTSKDMGVLRIIKSERCSLLYTGSKDQFTYSQLGDTLFLQQNKGGNMELHCPDIRAIQLTRCGVILGGVGGANFPRLQISADDSCIIELEDIIASAVYLRGQAGTTLRIKGNSTIDSLYLQLGKQSDFYSGESVSYKYTNMKIDSIRELNMSGKSLNTLKEIK